MGGDVAHRPGPIGGECRRAHSPHLVAFHFRGFAVDIEFHFIPGRSSAIHQCDLDGGCVESPPISSTAPLPTPLSRKRCQLREKWIK